MGKNENIGWGLNPILTWVASMEADMMLQDKDRVRKEVGALLRMAEMHANVGRKTLLELYRRNNHGSLPDWKLEESDSLEYRWQPYEDPAPEMPKHRGRDVRYCAVNQRKYDWGKGQFREGVCEELGVDRRMVKALTEAGNSHWGREAWRTVEAHLKHYEKQEGKGCMSRFPRSTY